MKVQQGFSYHIRDDFFALFEVVEWNQKQQEYESRIRRYEVVGVHKYLKTTTNNFGGVIRTDVCYTFTYLAGGVLYSVEGFDHNRIIIGNTDMYIINNNNGTQTLQLTKETLANMKGLD
mgnify:CR=1 FL=1